VGVDWSPDGQWLGHAGTRGELFIVPAVCGDQPQPCGPDSMVRLTNGGNNKAPSFSPDSQWVTFASQLDGDNEIWIMRLDGSGLTQLTFNSYADWQPRWGP
jgi:Tol biopolymer transport system component